MMLPCGRKPSPEAKRGGEEVHQSTAARSYDIGWSFIDDAPLFHAQVALLVQQTQPLLGR